MYMHMHMHMHLCFDMTPPTQIHTPQELAGRHTSELNILQQQFEEEAASFTEAWGREMAGMQEAARAAEGQLLERQLNEIAEVKVGVLWVYMPV